jgi:hypothetical protein
VKSFFKLIVVFGLSCTSYGQVVLPYYTGFDNAAEKANWVQFIKGWKGSRGWGIAPSGGYSPPAYLGHDRPYGAAATDTTIDWYVSPPFDFFNGGVIDSLKLNVHVNDSLTRTDQIGVYLLVGSKDPALASRIIPLADLTHFSTKNYLWKDTNIILIPSTPGLSYIGIKYSATQNAFTVRIDNIFVNRAPIGVPEKEFPFYSLMLYPDPAYDKLRLGLIGKKINKANVAFYNCAGQKICEKQIENENQELDISQFTEGTYFVQLNNDGILYNKKFIVLKH